MSCKSLKHGVDWITVQRDKYGMDAWQLRPESEAIVIDHSQLDTIVKQRLIDLGFRSGEKIICLKETPFSGPKIYKNSIGIFSLEKEIAENINVRIP
jgi:Fe2+ transport system protein FeoA